MARAEIMRACQLAWQTGLMRGFSGNASLRLDNGNFLITASGIAKGRMTEADILEIDGAGNVTGSQPGRPSLETRLHLGLYAACSSCGAILHTHPVWMQALEQRLHGTRLADSMLNLNLTEADYWRERIAIAPEHAPGSPELAEDAVSALRRRWGEHPHLPCAIWLSGHGLCALGDNIDSCLGVSEQLEHIAQVQWGAL